MLKKSGVFQSDKLLRYLLQAFLFVSSQKYGQILASDIHSVMC